jgi:hypothetical protein
LAGLAFELKRPVQLKHPLPHIDDPQASRFPGLAGVAANAIIGYRKANATVGSRKSNLHSLRLRIFGGVAERFLRDAVETERGARR